jgi:serine/threonine-protein kinase RsbW
VSRSSVRAPITLRLPFEARSVSVARQRLKSWMSDIEGGSRDSIEDARVVISELVANAVRHARPLSDGNLLVTWTLEGDGVQVSVTDGGSATRPRALETSSSALSGRGMAIVEVLAHTWWTEESDSRSTVHALIEV